jgi:hypothetical protein
MRYGLHTELPINAFSPRGGRGPFSHGMTLEGGGGGIPIISDVVNAVSDVGEAVGGAIGDVGSFIDDAVIQPAIQDPVGTVVKIGAIAAAPATGGASLYAIPTYTATKAIAAGVPIGDVAQMAAISAAATYAGVSVADYVGTLAEFGTQIGSQQTAMLAAQNVGIGTGSALSTGIGQIAGGAIGGGVGTGLMGGDIGEGLLGGAVNAGIGAGVGGLVDAGAGLFNQTNTGSTQMDELFGPSYAELGYNPSGADFFGPTYSELGYTPGGFSDFGSYPGFMEDIGLGGSSSGLTDLSGESGSRFLESLGLNTNNTGFDTNTLVNLTKQYGTQAVKSLIGSTTGGASGGARRAQLRSQGYSDSQIDTILGTTGLLGAGANYFLNQNQLGKLDTAYSQNVAAQQAAAQQAQQQASFTPVGMTTAFGQSNFQFDPTTGKMTAAGYTPTEQVAGQVQNLFGLGAQALPTTANTQDVQQQYIAQQQGLLAPGREQQLAQLRNRQYQRGTTGLATGGTMAGYTPNAQGLMATNPEMAAYYNAQAQQNAALAANAPTYAQNLLNQQIATGTGLFGAANTLEQYAQQPLALSSSLGAAGAGAGAKAGYYGLLGAQGAQATQLQGQLANIYGQGAALGSVVNPLVTAAGQGVGSVLGNWLS